MKCQSFVTTVCTCLNSSIYMKVETEERMPVVVTVLNRCGYNSNSGNPPRIIKLILTRRSIAGLGGRKRAPTVLVLL